MTTAVAQRFLKLFVVAQCVVTTFVLNGCSKKSADTIIGKWHERDDPPENVTEFRADGTVSATEVTHAGTPDHPSTFTNLISGKYWLLAANRIKVDVEQKDGPRIVMTNEFQVNSDGMDMVNHLSPDHPNHFHFDRVK